MTDPDHIAVEIVDLSRHHLKALLPIDAQVYTDPWSKRLWTAELDRDRRIYLAAMYGRELVGYAGALLVAEDVHVTTIVTAPRHQRRGIGATLLLALVRRAIAAGATALTLEVRASNDPAQALYRRFGMAPVGIRRGYYEPEGEDALIMWAHDIDSDSYAARLDSLAGELSSRAEALA